MRVPQRQSQPAHLLPRAGFLRTDHQPIPLQAGQRFVDSGVGDAEPLRQIDGARLPIDRDQVADQLDIIFGHLCLVCLTDTVEASGLAASVAQAAGGRHGTDGCRFESMRESTGYTVCRLNGWLTSLDFDLA